MPPLVVAFAFVGAIGMWAGDDEPAGSVFARDGDLCPVDPDRVSGKAVFLFDLRKPLGGVPANHPGRLLRDLTQDLERDTEIRAYLITGSPSAPRALLERFCKPFDTHEIQVASAKDQNGDNRDCDDLPAQLAADVRYSAARYCSMREALRARLDTLVAQTSQKNRVVTDAYLVEAIEESRLELQHWPGTRRLHVFSDMMQHADWYSHLDLDWTRWNYDDFSRLLASRHRLYGQSQPAPDIDVDIHYWPREGNTTRPRAGQRHRQFWQAYFRGSSVEFHEQSSIPAYASHPLMDLNLRSSAVVQASPVEQERAVPRPLPGAMDTEERDRQTEGQPGSEPLEPVLTAQQAEPIVQSLSAEEPESLEKPVAERQPVETQAADPLAPEMATPKLAEASQQSPIAAVPASYEHNGVGALEQVETAQASEESHAQQPPALELEALDRAIAERRAGTPPEQANPLQSGENPVAAPEIQVAEQLVENPADRAASSLDSALTGNGQTAAIDAVQVPCPLEFQSDPARWRPEYPLRGRRDLGNAAITVRYAVNEAGETIDESVAVVTEQSHANRMRHFNRFVQEALDSVRDWRVTIPDPDTRACTLDLSYVTTFQFRYE